MTSFLTDMTVKRDINKKERSDWNFSACRVELVHLKSAIELNIELSQDILHI